MSGAEVGKQYLNQVHDGVNAIDPLQQHLRGKHAADGVVGAIVQACQIPEGR